jgi:AcrR family transcriptional regulator
VGERLPAEQRRRQLLDVACPIFAERGFHETSMDDIAGAAGVTKPVLYQHFPSKRALFVELLDDVGRRLLIELQAETSQAVTGRERVEAGFAAYFRFVTDNPPAFRLLFGAAARNDAEFAIVVDRVLDDATDAISRLIEIDAGAEHRRVLAHALIGVAEATSRDALTGDRHDAATLAHWVSELAWFGLRGVRSEDAAPAASGGGRDLGAAPA